MKYRLLGRTGLQISEIGFGGWAIGGPFEVNGIPAGWGPVDDRQSRAAVLLALDRGINFFDTADIYGLGHSETILGDALRGHRDQVVIASKVGNRIGPEGRTCKDFSSAHIVKACEVSLQRLRTDYIDLYQLHNPSAVALWNGDAPEALERLQGAGKIRHFGVSISRSTEGRSEERRVGKECRL